MTTEIAIMNKEAVALAADSAVTTGRVQDKIFNSANKLFPLGRDHSVGIMIYQNADFMGIPWEFLIKIYRDKVLRQRSFKTLKAYGDSFIRFLNNPNSAFKDLVSQSEQERYFGLFVDYQFDRIVDYTMKQAFSERHPNREALLTKLRTTAQAAIQAALDVSTDNLKNDKKYQSIPNSYLTNVERRYGKITREAAKRIFGKPPISLQISQALQGTIDKMVINAFAAHYLYPDMIWKDFTNYSGVVIAGFGEDDKFPSLDSYKVGGVVGDRLISVKDNHYKSNRITPSNRGRILTFAQERTIQTFLTGIDPTYEEKLVDYFERKTKDLSKGIIAKVGSIGNKQRQGLQKQIEENIKKAKDDYQGYVWNLGFDHSLPIEAFIVSVLPKGELASMAETLVSLASFERRVSPGRETVGGPIDVAVISKVDGFIWVKKKSYFTLEMNPDYYEGT